MKLARVWQRLGQRFSQDPSKRPGRTPKKQTEQETPRDRHQATTRVTGGVHRPGSRDAHSTTGPNDSGVFVGRVSGQDTGYDEETGAERRAQEDSSDEQ